MKTYRFWLLGALALLAFASCDDNEEPGTEQGDGYTEAYYAGLAGISSSNANFSATENGGEISFLVAGGSVAVNVDCGIEWTATIEYLDTEEGWLATDVDCGSGVLTVTATQNTVEIEKTAAVTVMTAESGIAFATIAVTQNAYGAPEITVETNEWNIPAVGDLSTEIEVTATHDWTAEAADVWVDVEKTATSIVLTASRNEDGEARTTTVVLSCTDGIRTASEQITVNQDGKAYINTSKSSLICDVEGGTDSITVESNFEWDYSYDTENGWFSVSRSGDSLTATANANETGENLTGTITLTAGDEAENVAEMELTVVQEGSNAMILTYSIPSGSTTVRLPIHSVGDTNVNVEVWWGDEPYSWDVTTDNPTHVYNQAGNYEVTIVGTVPGLYTYDYLQAEFTDFTQPENNPFYYLTSVKQWGNTGLTDMSFAFDYCVNLESLPEYTGRAFDNVTSFNSMCRNCYALKEIPAGIFDRCTEATNFYWVFNACRSLTSIPAGLFANCTKAEDFEAAFAANTSLTEIPTDLFTNSPATTFESCFNGCTALKEVPKRLFGYCPNAENFYGVFYNCTNIKELPENLFNCPEATDFHFAFYQNAITAIPFDLFTNCPKAQIFEYTFENCESLLEVPLGLFDSCTEATDFQGTFMNCYKLEALPNGLFDHCPNAETFQSCFSANRALKEIPAGLFDNCPKVTSFYSTFANCWVITEIPEGLFDNCPEVETFQTVFSTAKALTSVPTDIFSKNLKVTNFSSSFYSNTELTGESPYDLVDGVRVHLYERANHPEIYTTPTSTSNCFYKCTNLDDYDDIPSSWGGGGN